MTIWSRPWAKYSILTLAGLLVLFTLVILGALVFLTSGPGARFVESRLDGREIGSIGTLEVNGLRGNLLNEFRAQQIAITDDDGAWLTLNNVTLDWRPGPLLSRSLVIQGVEAEEIVLVRLPQGDAQQEPKPKREGRLIPELPVTLDLDHLAIDRLEIGEQAFGRAAVLEAEGSALWTRRGTARVLLGVEEANEGQDSLSLEARYDRQGDIILDLDASSGPEGLFSQLLRAPEGASSSLTAQVTGDPEAGDGEANLAFSGNSVLDADFVWRDGDAEAAGVLALSEWPLLAPLAERAGERVEFSARIQDYADETRGGVLRLTAPRLNVTAEGSPNLAEGVDIDAAIQDLGAWSGGAAQGEQVSWTGKVRQPESGGWSGDGRFGLTGLEAANVRVGEASGPVSFAYEGGVADVQTQISATGVDAGVEALAGMLGDEMTLALDGSFDQEAGQVSFAQLDVRSGAISAETQGRIGLQSGQIEVTGNAALSDLSGVTGLITSGRTAVDFEFTQNGKGAPYRIVADGQVQDFQSTQDALNTLVGNTARYNATAEIAAGGAVRIEEARVVSQQAEIGGAGSLGPDQGYNLDLEAVIDGPVTLSGATIQGRALTRGDLTGPFDAPALDLTVFADDLTTGGITFTRPQADIRVADLTGDFRAEIDAEAGTQYGPANAAAIVSRAGERIQLADLSASLADARVNGSLSLGGGAPMEGELQIAKTGEGPSPYPGTLNGTARLTGQGGEQYVELDVNGENIDLPAQQVRIDTMQAQAEGLLSYLDYTVTTDGSVRGLPLTANASGEVSQTEAGRRITAALESRYGRLNISTQEPIVTRFGPEGRQLTGLLAIGDGRLDIDIDQAGEQSTMQVALIDTPLAVFETLRPEPRLSGLANARVSLTSEGQTIDGTIDATVDDAQVESEGLEPIDLSLTGDVNNSRLSLQFGLQDPSGLRVEGSGNIPLRQVEGFLTVRPDPDAPLSGMVRADGPIESLTALFTGPQQRLAGQIDAEVDLGGTLNDSRVDGRARLSGGEFDDATSGIALRNITTTADFASDRLEVTELSATDTGDGTLSGTGQLRSQEGGWAGTIEANFREFQVVNRDDAQAEASGELQVRIDPENPAIEGDIEILRGEFQPPSAGPPGVTTIEVVEINKPGAEDEETVTGERGTPFALDLTLSADRRLFIRSNILTVEMGLDARIAGTTANPEIYGEAFIVRGDATLAGQRFTFEEGTISFDGPPTSAELDLTAQRDTGDLTAFINVTGTPQEPRISLSSEPELPQDEILSRVLFGRSASELSALEAAQLAAALASLRGGGGFDALGQLRSGLGLDRLAVAQTSGGTMVSGGRYLTDDVYLELQSGGEAGAAAQIEWQALKNFSIVSRFGSSENTGVSVRWQRDY